MKKIVLFLLITLLYAACKDPYMDSVYTDTLDNFPAATYMDNDSSLNVSHWVALLKHADMFNTLNLQANYTCFVPDNQAINAMLASKGLSAVNQLTTADAKLLVRYHTITGKKYSAVDFNEGMLPDSTASGDYLSTTFLENGGKVLVNEEAILQKTLQVTNAYIHIIDKVLTPVTETIWEKLQTAEFSILKAAFELTGFQQRLNTVITVETGPGGAEVFRKYRYTLFATPDAVFQDKGIQNVNDLIQFLGAGNDYTNPKNALHLYMGYQLLNQQYSFAELSFFEQTDNTRSRNYNTMALNQLINVSEKNKAIYINWVSAAAGGIGLVKLNQNCKNGVIHTIDQMLVVKSPNPTRIRWELTDFPELSYIPFYRKAAGTSTQQRQINVGEVKSYRWLAVPESKNGLTYELVNRNDAVKMRGLNSDFLLLSLGTFGWVEMTTPTIIAGKYSVFLEHFNPKGQDLSGRLMFILNGNYFGAQIATTGANKTTDQYLTNTKIGEVTFTETTTHTLRILAGDNTTSYLDCITFQPM